MLTVAPGLVIRRETSRRLCAPQMWSPGQLVMMIIIKTMSVIIMIEMMVELMVMMEFKLAMMEIMMLQQ